jgi:glycosyltransferase involved in cell wall biosynthesis
MLPHPTVACLVRNSVSHDARVLKEADALASAGYRVVIVGVMDRKVSELREVRASGVEIVRVPVPQALLGQRYARTARIWGIVGLVGLSLVAALIFRWSAVRDAARGWMIEHAWDLVPLGLLAVILAVAGAAFLRLRRSLRSARIKRAELGLAAGVPAAAGNPVAGVAIGCLRKAGLARQWVTRLLAGVRVHGKSRVIAELMHAELDRIRPDAVHCHDLPTLPVGAAWRRRNPGAKVAFDSHEIYDAVARMPFVASWMWRRTLARHAPEVDLFITINDSIASLLRQRDPALPPAVIVRNATRLPESRPRPDGRLRRAAGIEPDQRVLLYQGGYQSGRGLERLLESAASLPEGWVLVMMGFGSMEAHLKALGASVDPVGRRIRFIPPAPHSELGAWTAGADLGLIPYENTCLNHWFCSPNKLWEYPVAGVPMLVSPFPELRAVVERHGVGKCLPEPLDGPGLARLLRSIDDVEIILMRENCRRFLEADHWGVYADRLCAAYRRMLPLPEADSLSTRCTSSQSSELVRSS